MYRNAGFKVRKVQPPLGWKAIERSFTVDTRDDYDAMVSLVQRFPVEGFSIQSVMADVAT
jgi:spore coat polysaccharide biosynthesis protein SpsF (cytidylyltransferase family)